MAALANQIAQKLTALATGNHTLQTLTSMLRHPMHRNRESPPLATMLTCKTCTISQAESPELGLYSEIQPGGSFKRPLTRCSCSKSSICRTSTTSPVVRSATNGGGVSSLPGATTTGTRADITYSPKSSSKTQNKHSGAQRCCISPCSTTQPSPLQWCAIAPRWTGPTSAHTSARKVEPHGNIAPARAKVDQSKSAQEASAAKVQTSAERIGIARAPWCACGNAICLRINC